MIWKKNSNKECFITIVTLENLVIRSGFHVGLPACALDSVTGTLLTAGSKQNGWCRAYLFQVESQIISRCCWRPHHVISQGFPSPPLAFGEFQYQSILGYLFSAFLYNGSWVSPVMALLFLFQQICPLIPSAKYAGRSFCFTARNYTHCPQSLCKVLSDGR